LLKKQGLRVETDLRNEKIGYKIRQSTLRRIPFMLVVGDREVAEGTVAVRTREGQDLGSLAVEGLLASLPGVNARARH
jgi:threonyl-tRNA synthetase